MAVPHREGGAEQGDGLQCTPVLSLHTQMWVPPLSVRGRRRRYSRNLSPSSSSRDLFTYSSGRHLPSLVPLRH